MHRRIFSVCFGLKYTKYICGFVPFHAENILENLACRFNQRFLKIEFIIHM